MNISLRKEIQKTWIGDCKMNNCNKLGYLGYLGYLGTGGKNV